MVVPATAVRPRGLLVRATALQRGHPTSTARRALCVAVRLIHLMERPTAIPLNTATAIIQIPIRTEATAITTATAITRRAVAPGLRAASVRVAHAEDIPVEEVHEVAAVAIVAAEKSI